MNPNTPRPKRRGRKRSVQKQKLSTVEDSRENGLEYPTPSRRIVEEQIETPPINYGHASPEADENVAALSSPISTSNELTSLLIARSRQSQSAGEVLEWHIDNSACTSFQLPPWDLSPPNDGAAYAPGQSINDSNIFVPSPGTAAKGISPGYVIGETCQTGLPLCEVLNPPNEYPWLTNNVTFRDNSQALALNMSTNYDPWQSSVFDSGEGPDERYLNHYKSFMRSFFSVKETTNWTYYTFHLRFIQNVHPEFPLRQAILAWAAFHLSYRENLVEHAPFVYYAKASEALNRLMAEPRMGSSKICIGPTLSTTPEMIISTSLFLCRCDVMARDFSALTERFRKLAEWLIRHNDDSKASYSGLSCKMLIWLSYLNVRLASFQSRQGDHLLIEVLRTSSHLPALLERSRLYIAECFGPSYPSSEIEDDLEQEVNASMKFEVVYLFSRVLSYRSWRKSLPARVDNSDQQELDTARVETLQSEIRRLRAELHLSMVTGEAPVNMASIHLSESTSTLRDIPITRTVFHWMTTLAIFHALVILFSRVLHPEMREEPEATKSVGSILKIALLLHRIKVSKPTQNKNMLWRETLFITAIETTDEIHFDWIVSLLDETATDYVHAENTRALLAEVQKKQDELGCRVEVEEVMESLGGGFMV